MRRLLFLLAATVIAGCGGTNTTGAAPAVYPTPTPTASTATPTPHASASPTPTATPTATPSPGPTAYTPTQHVGYVAVPYGNSAPQHVAIFPPSGTTGVETITYAGCCITSATFDSSANLLLATSDQGLVEYYPGAPTTPVRTISAQNGVAVAADPQGDSAIGGYAFGTSIAVYPGGTGALRTSLPGAPGRNGLAFSATGELAVAQSDGSVATFARGATTPNRTIAVNLLDGSGHNTAALAYDSSGNLAIGGTASGTVGVYAAGATTTTYSVAASAQSVAFTSSGALVIGTATDILVTVAGITVHDISGVSPLALSADANGNFAAANGAAASTVYTSTFATTTLSGATPSTGIAISP
jgi:hypothetical protein